MLDQIVIFHKAGSVLWSKVWVPSGTLKGSPVDSLIHHVLLEVSDSLMVHLLLLC